MRSPVPLAAAALAVALASCASARVPDHRLADRAADCSCAFSLLMEAAVTPGPYFATRTEPLIANVGYYIAAGEALSDRRYVQARRTATLAEWSARRSALERDDAREGRRRRFLDAIQADLAECDRFREEHRRTLDAAAREGGDARVD